MEHDKRIYTVIENKPNKVYFSKIVGPDNLRDFRSFTIKPRWLMSFVLFILRKLGFKVQDLR